MGIAQSIDPAIAAHRKRIGTHDRLGCVFQGSAAKLDARLRATSATNSSLSMVEQSVTPAATSAAVSSLALRK